MNDTKIPLKNYLKRHSFIFTLMGVFLYSPVVTGTTTGSIVPDVSAVQQQRVRITGKVIDKQGEPLVAATVQVKGTTLGTATDIDGNFILTVPDRESVLLFSYVTFESKEVKVGNQDFIAVTLMEKENVLDDAVVIGYQTVNRRKVHGAVTSVRTEDLKGISAPSIDIMLQGMVPGLNVQVFSGEPGSRGTFTIRGNTEVSRTDLTSSPLIVLDGIPVDPSVVGYSPTNTNFLSNINPNDIETLDFLKDAAAAAIYGSKAANGVLIINTKRGKEGKPRVSFNGRSGIIQKPVTPDIYKGAAERWAKLDRFQTYGSIENLGLNPQMLTDSINPMFNNATDWFDLFYRDAWIHDYNLSVSGGDAHSNYRLGAGYYTEKGTMVGNGFQRFSFNGTFQNKVANWLEFNTNIAYNNSKREPVPVGNAVTGANGMNVANMPSTLFYLPEIDKENLLGKYKQGIYDNNESMIKLGENIMVDILGKELTFNSQLSYLQTNYRVDRALPSTSNVDHKSSASSESNTVTTWTIENYINYNKAFKNHQILLLAGQSAEGIKRKGSYLYGEYLPSDYINVVNGVSKDNMNGNSSIDESTMASFFGRAFYIFKDRYSLSASIRTDGSSRLGKRWGTFPTVSAYWILSEEDFMKNIENIVSFAKVRASWGKSGDLPGGYYGYHNRYTTTSSTYDGASGIVPNFGDGIAQKELTWEETREWNLGLDLYLMENRFSIIADVYNREKHGIFFSFNLPKLGGYERYFTNAVAVRNAGFELALNAQILPPQSKLQWSMYANFSFNKNRIMRLPEGNRTVGQRLRVGSPLNTFYLSEYLGVFSTDDDVPFNPFSSNAQKYLAENGVPFIAGSGHYADIDGDWQFMSYLDKRNIGDPNPDCVGGFGTNLRYGPWSLFAHASFTLGRDIYNRQKAQMLSAGMIVGGWDEEGRGYSGWGANWNNTTEGHWYGHEDFIARRMLIDLSKYTFWQKPGDRTQYPSLSPYASVLTMYPETSVFLENGSYLKLNTVMLSYDFNFPKIDRLTLSFTAENVAVLKSKNTSAADPSIVSPDGFYTGNGYGVPRKFTLGLMLNF